MKSNISIKYFFPVKLSILVVLIILAVLLVLSIGGCGSSEQHRFSRFLMDTHVTMNIYADSAQAEEVKEEAFSEMERLEGYLSRSVEGSDVWRINENAGVDAVEVDDITLEVLQKALHYAEATEGAFDITVAPLLDLWGLFDPELEAEDGDSASEVELDTIPSTAEIEEKLELVDFESIEINEETNEVFLPHENMALDLGGVAKGYIVDRGIEILSEAGIEHALIDGGGDIRVIGERPDDTPWKIGIQDPQASGNMEQSLLAVLSLKDTAVVTSGDYERYVEVDGERYHHILDPETGYPSEELTSVTIAAEDAAGADAISTGVFIMGLEEGMQLIEETAGVDGVLVTQDHEVEYSSGLEGKIDFN